MAFDGHIDIRLTVETIRKEFCRMGSRTEKVWAKTNPKPELIRRFLFVTAAAVFTISTITACGPVVETPQLSEKPAASTQPEVDTPEAPELTFEQKVEAYKIPDGLSKEELAKTVLDKLAMWSNAGASDSLKSYILENNESIENLMRPIADEEALPAIDALLPDDWRDNANLVEFVTDMTRHNHQTVVAFAETNWHERYSEGFRSWNTVESVHELKGGDQYRQLTIDFVEQSNHDTDGGSAQTLIINTTVTDGSVKLVSAEFKRR